MYQKCVCFLFLVILAILSCSGFRIDNLAMTDLTKKNYRTSLSSTSNSNRFLQHRDDSDSVHRQHRIRHHRLWRTQAHNRPHIDAIVYPPSEVKPTLNRSSQLNFELDELRYPPASGHFPHTPLSPAVKINLGLPAGEVNRGFPAGKVNLGFPAGEVNRGFHAGEVNLGFPAGEVNRGFHAGEVNLGFPAGEVNLGFPAGKVAPGPPGGEVNASLGYPTLFPSETLAQIPPTELLPLNSRAQRSSDRPKHNNNKKNRAWSNEQSEDFMAKAFRAKYVVLGKAVGELKYTNESNDPCGCYFKAIRDYKGNTPEYFRLFGKWIIMECDLVKRLDLSKEYLLLLGDGSELLGAPKSPKGKLKERMAKFARKGFVPTKPKIYDLTEVLPKSRKKVEKKNRILVCKVKGTPTPKITWRRKNQVLHHSKAYRILYKRKQSRLIIKKSDAEFLGQYQCLAESLDGHVASKNFTVLPPRPNKDCEKKFKQEFCQNGGTCFTEASMGIVACICPEYFTGERCQTKLPGDTRLLRMTSRYENWGEMRRKKLRTRET